MWLRGVVMGQGSALLLLFLPQLLLLFVEELHGDACGVGLRGEEQIPKIIHEGRRVLLEEAHEIELHRLGIDGRGLQLPLDVADHDLVVEPEVLCDLCSDPRHHRLHLHLAHVDPRAERGREFGRLQHLLRLVGEAAVLVDADSTKCPAH